MKGSEAEDGEGGNGELTGKQKFLAVLQNICVVLLLPFLWLYDCFVFVIGERLFRWGRVLAISTKRQAHLFLNGMKPYECSTRITVVNLVVLCSTWYMFIDQMRLAFFPTNADWTLAVIDFVIWTIIVLDLLCEVFIRPEGFQELKESDKAFSPTTARYIGGLHLTAELISLAFFVPEFLCIFPGQDCDDSPRFSFLFSALHAVTGPTRTRALAGRAFFAVIRFRVFALDRHWKVWRINQTFLKRRASEMAIKEVDETPDRYGAEEDAATDSAEVQGPYPRL